MLPKGTIWYKSTSHSGSSLSNIKLNFDAEAGTFTLFEPTPERRKEVLDNFLRTINDSPYGALNIKARTKYKNYINTCMHTYEVTDIQEIDYPAMRQKFGKRQEELQFDLVWNLYHGTPNARV